MIFGHRRSENQNIKHVKMRVSTGQQCGNQRKQHRSRSDYKVAMQQARDKIVNKFAHPQLTNGNPEVL